MAANLLQSRDTCSGSTLAASIQHHSKNVTALGVWENTKAIADRRSVPDESGRQIKRRKSDDTELTALDHAILALRDTSSLVLSGTVDPKLLCQPQSRSRAYFAALYFPSAVEGEQERLQADLSQCLQCFVLACKHHHFPIDDFLLHPSDSWLDSFYKELCASRSQLSDVACEVPEAQKHMKWVRQHRQVEFDNMLLTPNLTWSPFNSMWSNMFGPRQHDLVRVLFAQHGSMLMSALIDNDQSLDFLSPRFDRVAPCLCPTLDLYDFRASRFVSGLEFMKIQTGYADDRAFMQVLPHIRQWPDRFLKNLAGNAFSTVACAAFFLSLFATIGPERLSKAKDMAALHRRNKLAVVTHVFNDSQSSGHLKKKNLNRKKKEQQQRYV